MAEEAVIKGIPVWQIISEKPNFSTFSSTPEIKKLSSVHQLSEELKQALERNTFGDYTTSFIDEVERKCFNRCDGRAAHRVAQIIKAFLKAQNDRS